MLLILLKLKAMLDETIRDTQLNISIDKKVRLNIMTNFVFHLSNIWISVSYELSRNKSRPLFLLGLFFCLSSSSLLASASSQQVACIVVCIVRTVDYRGVKKTPQPQAHDRCSKRILNTITQNSLIAFKPTIKGRCNLYNNSHFFYDSPQALYVLFKMLAQKKLMSKRCHVLSLVLLLWLIPLAVNAFASSMKRHHVRSGHWKWEDNLFKMNRGTVNSDVIESTLSFMQVNKWDKLLLPTHRSSSCIYSKKDGSDDSDDSNDEMIPDVIQNANLLEIRLDATLASCYGLCRFLIYDITTGAKDVPGWQLSDLIMLGGAFSSCIILSLIWSVVGIYTGVFEARYSDDYDLLNIASTAAIVGPLWLIVEIGCGWPPSGVMLANDFAADSSITVYTIATGTIGLMSVMCLGKTLTSGWR